MNNVGYHTLREFFSLQEVESLGKRRGKIQPFEGMAQVKESLSAAGKEISWALACDEIVKRIGDLLDIRVVNILAGAWNKHRELMKYSDRSKYSPDETILVHLVDHTIKSIHNPCILILVNNDEIGRINFEIAISLTLQGIILKIQNGRIKEAMAGSWKGKGTLKCEKFLLLETETESFNLSESISFGDGISLK
jgi:hypothetical protein